MNEDKHSETKHAPRSVTYLQFIVTAKMRFPCYN